MEEGLKGVVVGYRLGPKTQRPKECLLQFPKVGTEKETTKLLGRKVVWSFGSKKFIGKILSPHGKNGLVRAKFRRGLPRTSHRDVCGNCWLRPFYPLASKSQHF